MESENNFGLTDPNIWENGRKEKLMAKASFSTQTETIMREIGAITKLAATDCTFMKMGTSMKESGKTMYNMDMEKNDGQMALVTKAHITRAQNTALDSINGPMDRSTMATGITMSSRALGSIHGLMEESIEGNGKIQICMELALTNGLMEEYLLGSTTMIKNMGMASTHGQMTVNTEDGGKKASKMD